MQEDVRKIREKKILEFMEDENYHPVRIKEMAAFFYVPKKERGEFHEIVDSLLNAGKIEIDKRGKLRIPRDNVMVGEFMATAKGFGFVRVEGQTEDIFIPEPDCANAFHGDIVRISLSGKAVEKGGERGMSFRL